MNLARTFAAMRADAIPAGESGLWSVFKRDRHIEADASVIHCETTYLSCVTEATLHTVGSLRNPPGDCVMTDARSELRTHLEAVRRARGRVLITGLGLGCVLRGILTRPEVDEIVVLERSKGVLALVRPFLPVDARLSVIETEALEWILEHPEERWDVVWHDLWTNPDNGEPHLALIHQYLLMALHGRCGWQGAWAFPRRFREMLRRDKFANPRPFDLEHILDCVTRA